MVISEIGGGGGPGGGVLLAGILLTAVSQGQL